MRTTTTRAQLLVVLGLTACASVPTGVNEGQQLVAAGRIDEGLAMLEQAARDRPTDAQARNIWINQREAVVNVYVREGDVLRTYGDLDSAEASYRRALRYDPNSVLAQGGIDAIARERRLLVRVRAAEDALQRGDLATAEQEARAVLAENSSQRGARAVMKVVAERRAQMQVAAPTLRAAFAKPITLEFRDAPIRSVFEVISRTSGINFVFDRDVRPDLRTTIFVRNASLDDVIKLLLATNQLERKVMNDNSILVYPNTPAKQKEYQELAVRSFYLANADAKQTAAMIRALVKTRDLFIDEKLNLVVMKDTADAIRLAEQLVATQDLGEPEVMLELEVLEVASSVIQEFGLRYPERINFGVLGADTGTGAGSLPALIELKPREWQYFVANPALILNLRKLDGSTRILANPRIRVKNRDKAKVHIGEKVPVITTTSTANVGVSSSVSYLETGLKLDVEPNIYLEDEVAIKVQLEVSNILEQLNVSGTVSYRLGTRNAATTLRLKDGETQVLAGLINDEDRRAANKVPYLGDVPGLGRLFRSDSDQRTKSEIVLLITPRVVRNLARPDTVQAQFPSGTDAAPGAAPLRLAATQSNALALAPGAGGQAPASRALVPPPAPGQAPGAAEPVALNVSVPPQVTLGQEFVVSLALPASNQGVNANVELSYDPAVINAVPLTGAPAGSGADPGRVIVPIAAPAVAGAPSVPAQVRLRVVAKAPTATQLRIDNITATDGVGRELAVTSPTAMAITVTGTQGATQ